jgi:hypothetical protein
MMKFVKQELVGVSAGASFSIFYNAQSASLLIEFKLGHEKALHARILQTARPGEVDPAANG